MYRRIFVVSFFLALGFGAALFTARQIGGGQLQASQLNALGSAAPTIAPSITPDLPAGAVRIIGTVIATLEGGRALGIQAGDRQFYVYTPNGAIGEFSGLVSVIGFLEDETCAYRRTVFQSCVPALRVFSIHSIEAQP